MADSNMILEGPIAVGLVWLGRRFLDTPTRLPAWDKWLVRLWQPTAVLFIICVSFGSKADLLADAFMLGIIGIGLAVTWQLRTYRPAWLLCLGLVPYGLLSVINLLVGLLLPRLLKTYEDWFDLAGLLTFCWQGVFWFMARSQQKSLVAEHQLRLQAEQEQLRIETKNQELEHQVHQRTATLAEQTAALRTTLNELKETQAQLIQREKMASLGELTAGIAHEIQNPLNFVNNFADVSAELITELEEERNRPTRDPALEAELLADLKQNLQRITQHGGRAAGIVRGMLEHSRASSGERQPTDLNMLADEYLRLAYHGLRAKDKSFNATLQPELAAGLPLVEMVAGDVGRVLLNLFTNAFYAVQQRQQLGEPGYKPTVGVRTRLVAHEVEVQVHDNGMGIPEGVKARIFQPFFTTKPAGEGTGLGLSLSHDIIVQGHGGTLTVQSEEGRGTTFTVRLPTA
ncbi:sensor histidine kinase [Hymenobacter sp. BRD67]|uniref:sensor histidine kinase n=1 Tax=Hymenobacter sp. BRD67 TaxID=2675877 RepID=UPI00156436F3|nr:ATP-binding protein [Hymenobacter sp. BRD67]QKG53200.1 histidine kinase [Hymenobacter sp. BRD67]